MLAAGCAASFLEAVREVAARRGQVLMRDCNVTASVAEADGGAGLAVSIDVDLPGFDRATAQALVAVALDLCPFAATLRDPAAVIVTIA